MIVTCVNMELFGKGNVISLIAQLVLLHLHSKPIAYYVASLTVLRLAYYVTCRGFDYCTEYIFVRPEDCSGSRGLCM